MLLQWEKQADRNRLIQSLCRGEVSIGSSDTIIGLIAPLSKEGFEALNKIKGRSEKPYLILIPSVDVVQNFSNRKGPEFIGFLHKIWPGPVTIVISAKEKIPAFMKSADNAIALRMPAHTGLQAIMKEVGPLFSTSANLAGKEVPKNFEQIDPEILKHVSYFIDNELPVESTIASTIIDCTKDEIKVVREGAYSIKKLEQIFGKKIKK